MKNWWMPTIAIVGFFVVLTTFFKMMPSSAPQLNENQAKVDRALKDLTSPVDSSEIKLKTNEKAPKWGSLKKQNLPKVESLSFKGDKTKTVSAGLDKKDKKNKKKKKKNSKKKAPITAIAKKIKTSEPNKEEIEDSNSGFGGAGRSLSNNTVKDPNALPETADEWEAYILNPPDVDKLMSFIKYRQASIINDEVYYTVCERMILSKHNDIRKFGVIALGSTPALQSFVLLSLAAENEDSEKLQTFITSQYHTYMSFQYVSLLGTALRSDNQAVRYFAALSIGESASLNIKSGVGSESRGRTSTVNKQAYISLIPVLQNLATKDANDRVRSAATHSLDVIRSLTQTSTVAFR